jgi:hypothetical protein
LDEALKKDEDIDDSSTALLRNRTAYHIETNIKEINMEIYCEETEIEVPMVSMKIYPRRKNDCQFFLFSSIEIKCTNLQRYIKAQQM